MRSHSSTLLAMAGCLVLTTTALICRYKAPQPVAFDSVMEFKDFARSKGLFFHTGNIKGVVWNNFLIADHPILSDDLPALSRHGRCGLTPAWRGVLWVYPVGGQYGIAPECLDGKWRIWGCVLVSGDEAFMDRIESLCRNK